MSINRDFKGLFKILKEEALKKNEKTLLVGAFSREDFGLLKKGGRQGKGFSCLSL